MEAERGGGDRAALTCFLLSALFAGGNAVGIRFTNRELDPLWGASLRFAAAALILCAVMSIMRLPLPAGRALRGPIVIGALTFGLAYTLMYASLVKLHAGFFQTLLGTVPLITLLLAIAHGQDRLRTSAVVGAVVALVGIGVMFKAPLDADIPLLSVLAVLGASACMAEGAVLVRQFPKVHAVTMNAIGMVVGATLLLAGSLAIGEEHQLPERAETWRALGYLIVFGSVLVFLLYLFVLGRWSASRTTYGFVLTPFVTLVLSAWLDDEPIGWELIVGGPLVLIGVYIGALRAGVTGPAAPEVPSVRADGSPPDPISAGAPRTARLR